MGLFFIVFGFIFFFIVRAYESGAARAVLSDARKLWNGMGVTARILAVLLIVACVIDGRTKGPSPLTSLYRVLFWHGADVWALLPATEDVAAAQTANAAALQAIEAATNLAADVIAYVETNEVITLSFDWHSPDRLPYHDRQNVLGRTVWVTPTNIAGVLYEDHYVAFNESATTNPAVILIEYATRDNDGDVVRFSAETVTNSFPTTYPITVQSGTHTCYWFRCAVPVAFTNGCLRDWNGEALFGSPDGSNKGFDLLGTLVIDDGNNVWVGATTNIIWGDVTNAVRNGVITED
jgi:hypothetical protein